MKIILLEKIKNLGSIGEEVTLNTGYIINYLLPNNKVLLLNKYNIEIKQEIKKKLFLLKKKKIIINNKTLLKIKNIDFIIIKKINNNGILLNNLTIKDIINILYSFNVKLKYSNILLLNKIRKTGCYIVLLLFYPNIKVKILFYVSFSLNNIIRIINKFK